MAEPYLSKLNRMIADLELPVSEQVSLECKHFFSGAALYANGTICASITPAGLGLKLPAETRERLFASGDGKELRHFEAAPVKKEYVLLSQSVVEDLERVKTLLNLSIVYAADA